VQRLSVNTCDQSVEVLASANYRGRRIVLVPKDGDLSIRRHEQVVIVAITIHVTEKGPIAYNLVS
jgi:hypothetical protein